ncbi:lyase [Nannocystaceae bacterium ST9]
MTRNRATTFLLLGLPTLLSLGCAGDSSGDDEVAADTTGAATTNGNDDIDESADGNSTTADGNTDADTVGTTNGDTATTTGDGDGDTTNGDTTNGDTATTTGDGDGDTTTGDGDGDPCQGGNMGFDYSYLWVANSDEGSVSKVNTTTLIEEGRYRTGPAGQYLMDPSRTTVSLDGRFAMVGNRNNGSVVLVAAVEDDCIDQNNDGMITTSQNKNDLKAWGTDECVLWKTDLPDVGPGIQSGPRGMTFDPGVLNEQTCQYENEKIWVGWHGTMATQAHMARLDPVTGAVEEIVDIDNWTMGWNDYPPYGAAYDGKGNVWFTALRGEVFRLSTADLSLDRWPMPAGTESYGMTVDFQGNAWFGGCQGPITTFDAMSETFSAVPGTNACYRGVAADSAGNIWVASNGPCGLMQVDAATKTIVKFHTAADFQNQCSTPVGVSIDVEGYVWMVDEAGWAWKIHPETYDKEMVMIVGDHYTYSDMTGGGLNAVVNPQ